MLVLARIVGIVVGVFMGVVIDEQLFTETPEWTAAITPTVFGILGWLVATFLVRRFAHRTSGMA